MMATATSETQIITLRNLAKTLLLCREAPHHRRLPPFLGPEAPLAPAPRRATWGTGTWGWQAAVAGYDAVSVSSRRDAPPCG